MGVAVAAFGGLGALLYGGALPCAFARIFGMPCPGCGSTRSVRAFVRGDLDGVLQHNPFGLLMAAVLGVFVVQALVSVFVRGDYRDVGSGRVGLGAKYALIVVAVLEVLLWIARFGGAFGGPVPV